MSQEIVRLEHPSIKEKINTLKSCQEAQTALLAQLDNLYKNVYAHDVERHKQFAEQFGSSQVLLQKRSHQERITQQLLTFSNEVLHSNITWNKLQMISSLSVQRAKLRNSYSSIKMCRLKHSHLETPKHRHKMIG